jgi:2-succinyl-5-enolpyruvyl-6-hydroxy-3-cyclohexene-1-carboxylate synthase
MHSPVPNHMHSPVPDHMPTDTPTHMPSDTVARMSSTTDTYLLLRAFVDELARCGMRAACTSPGSRCAPLVLTLAREQRLRCYSHIDERCAGYFALGLAKASGLPVAVACTSGTAAAELLPAAIEAHEARVPLLLLTADRPPELRDNGAGQAIDQLKLYGGAAKWFFEVGTHDASEERVRWMRTLACRAYWTALEGRPGVVHLNFPLREPLVSDEPLPADDTGRPKRRPYVRRAPAIVPDAGVDIEDESWLRELVAASRRGVVVAGRYERDGSLGAATAAFCAAAGWPLLADPLSGARRGEAAVAHYDALLRDRAFAASHHPDLVLRVGDLPVSKPLRTWLASLEDVRQMALDPESAWQDPASVLSDSLALEPVATLTGLTVASTDAKRARRDPSQTSTGPSRTTTDPDQTRGDTAWTVAEEGWLASWRSADERAARALSGVLGEELSEPRVAAELGVGLAADATLFVASSMPVRDIETFWPVRADPPRVLCNRGANGIDGTVSAAFGVAAHAAQVGAERDEAPRPVVLLIGDVALAYDLGGLLAASRLGLALTIVLLDNSGGGIFDFLPVAQTQLARAVAHGNEGEAGLAGETGTDIYTRHIATPTGLDFAAAAALYGLAYDRPASLHDLRAACERMLAPGAGSGLIHVSSERGANVALHHAAWAAVAQSLA